MGTIYQPEAAAEAIFRAVERGVSEYWVGISTALTIVGNMVAAPILDRVPARSAFKGQQTDEPVQSGRDDNLDHSITASHRTHGRFDKQAKARAIFVSGDAAHAAVLAVGALVFFEIGLVVG